MKKTILAIAIPALFASAANAAAIYDKDGTTVSMTGNLRSNYAQSEHGGDGDIQGRARMGFDVKNAINNTWSGLAKAEWQYTAQKSTETDTTYSWALDEDDQANTLTSREVYVGVDGSQFGKIRVGQFDNAMQDINKADFAEEGSGAALLGANKNNRDEGQIRYDGKWNGFNTGWSYVTKDSSVVNNDDTADIDALDHAWAGQVGYEAPFGLAVNTAYERRDYNNETTGQKSNTKAWGLGTSYTNGGLYVGAMYNRLTETDEATSSAASSERKARGYDFGVSYTIDAVTPYVIYDNVKYDETATKAAKRTIYTTFGVDYALTSNFKTYTTYQVNNGADDKFNVGLKYSF